MKYMQTGFSCYNIQLRTLGVQNKVDSGRNGTHDRITSTLVERVINFTNMSSILQTLSPILQTLSII